MMLLCSCSAVAKEEEEEIFVVVSFPSVVNIHIVYYPRPPTSCYFHAGGGPSFGPLHLAVWSIKVIRTRVSGRDEVESRIISSKKHL